uniref:Uncharacterized protein n=1 Tax=Anguilla anguilla TaxID=7936 RepID=A0A0E9U7B1_ANGAN
MFSSSKKVWGFLCSSFCLAMKRSMKLLTSLLSCSSLRCLYTFLK